MDTQVRALPCVRNPAKGNACFPKKNTPSDRQSQIPESEPGITQQAILEERPVALCTPSIIRQLDGDDERHCSD